MIINTHKVVADIPIPITDTIVTIPIQGTGIRAIIPMPAEESNLCFSPIYSILNLYKAAADMPTPSTDTTVTTPRQGTGTRAITPTPAEESNPICV